MTAKRGFPWAIIALGAFLVFILCVGCVLIGGIMVFLWGEPATSPEIPATLPPIPTEAAPPTATPIPNSIQPTKTNASPLTENQQTKEFYLFDDFSSKALGWPEFNDGTTIIQYEDGQYSIQITKPDYFDWAYVPVEFKPFEISFDVTGLPGPQNGTFGVFCQYQNENNHYYVEIDLETRSYIIGQYANGEDHVLTSTNPDNPWQMADPLKAMPTETNHIGISCYQDFITLFINDEWVTEVAIKYPADNPGDMALFIYAFDFSNSNGYKIFFDNVEVYKPVQ